MCLRRRIEVRVVHARPRRLREPAVSREHEVRFSAWPCSCRRSRRVSRLHTPPTRVVGVRIASTFPRSYRRATTSSLFGAPPNPRRLRNLRTASVLRSVAPGPPAIPGIEALRFPGSNSRHLRPVVRPETLRRPPRRFGPVSAKVHCAAAHLTSACSGLAALAADARR
jgi:hypothetical protein